PRRSPGGARVGRGPRSEARELDGQQTPEEGPIASQRDPHVLGRDIVAAAPLAFKLGPLIGKRLGELLDKLRNQFISLGDCLPGIVDEVGLDRLPALAVLPDRSLVEERDRKSTRLNSSHVAISYAVFCLKKKKRN